MQKMLQSNQLTSFLMKENITLHLAQLPSVTERSHTSSRALLFVRQIRCGELQ